MTNNKQRTLIVYKGSHLLHEQYFKENNIDQPRNWHVFDEEYIDSLKHLKQVLTVNEGDLVIWDSRTYHQNTCGNLDCMEERLVQYLCFLPKNNVNNDDEQKKKRLNCYKRFRTTSHWPYPITPVPQQPNIYNYHNPKNLLFIDYDSLPVPELDDLQNEIYKLL